MIINLIFNNYFNEKSIENLTYFNVLIISIYTSYNLYFNQDLSNNIYYLFYYILLDILIIPFKRIDTFIHHIDTILILYYLYYYNIDIKNNNFSTVQLLKTEISSIFLATTYFMKNLNVNKTLINISNLIFMVTFFKYRLYDYSKNVILNQYFFDSLTTINTNFQIYYKYSTTVILYCLNLYWFVIILKIFFKSLKLKLKNYKVEYVLQYSYILCSLSTIFTYVYYFNDKNHNNINLIILDIFVNTLLSLSSYFYHNRCYNLYIANKDKLDDKDNNYITTILIDVFIINVRALTNVFIHFKFNNIYYQYCNLLYTQSFIFISKFLFLCYKLIKKKEIDNLPIIFGLNPFICIFYSTIGVFNQYSGILTNIILFFIFLITLIVPFYQANHLMVHICMIFINHLLVINNITNTINYNN